MHLYSINAGNPKDLNVKYWHGCTAHCVVVFAKTSLSSQRDLNLLLPFFIIFLHLTVLVGLMHVPPLLPALTWDPLASAISKPGWSSPCERLFAHVRNTLLQIQWIGQYCLGCNTSSWFASTQTTSKTREAMRMSTGEDGHRSSAKTSSVERSHGSTPAQSLLIVLGQDSDGYPVARHLLWKT